MLYESPLSVGAALFSMTLVVPEAVALLEHPQDAPGGGLVAGAAVFAVGAYLGSSVALSCASRAVRLSLAIAWVLLAVALSAVVLIGAGRATGWWQLLLCGICVLPASGVLLAHFQSRGR